ncbi:MAG: D-alanine--D-alanine ligase [Longispora sp.]|nr:D-alanine--D-alanine ligase [Longispora sp. (in: high G+C Gram-positive bacteria)]
MNNAQVLVLAGGLSYEREVSLRSGGRVLDALGLAGFDAQQRDADAALLPALALARPDMVLIALHGATGEDGSLRGVLELAGVPYIGPDARAARRAWDKPTAKAVIRDAGLPTPDWVTLTQETFSELGANSLMKRVIDTLDLPLMVKPAQGGSGFGAQIVRAAEELPAAMVNCFSYGKTALIEKYVTGVDIAVSIIDTGDGPNPLPAVEIVPPNGIYDYAARYTAGVTTWHTPARLAPEVSSQVAKIAVTAYQALGLRDLSRIDLIVDAEGGVHFLEANVSPGLTETSLVPMAIEAAGLDFGEVMGLLVEQAARRG